MSIAEIRRALERAREDALVNCDARDPVSHRVSLSFDDTEAAIACLARLERVVAALRHLEGME